MIKRTIALLMVFSILLGLTACGAKPQEAAASAAAAVTADASAAAETQTPPAAVQLSSMSVNCTASPARSVWISPKCFW